MAFWDAVLASGRGRAIGYDRPPLDGPAFCRWMRRPSVHPWLVTWRGTPMALYYLTDRQGRAARVHFCILPCGTRRVDVPPEVAQAVAKARAEQGGLSRAVPRRLPLTQAAALFGLASALWEGEERGFLLDTLIGVTPKSNVPALSFIRSLGAKLCGEVPDMCRLYDAGRNVPGILTVFDRGLVPRRAAAL